MVEAQNHSKFRVNPIEHGLVHLTFTGWESSANPHYTDFGEVNPQHCTLQRKKNCVIRGRS